VRWRALVGALTVVACADATDVDPPDAFPRADANAATVDTGSWPDVFLADEDAAATLSPAFEPCEVPEDCLFGYCVESPEGGLRCSRPCDAQAADCPAGWTCAPISNGGVDRTFVCVAPRHSLCRPCDADGDCLGPGSRCLDGRGGRFCGLDCSADGVCPADYRCDVIDASKPEGRQCVPEGELGCAACDDPDGDGFGRGAGCRGLDCDETTIAVHEGATERCDGLDNDCDGTVDDEPAPAGTDAEIDCTTTGVCAGAAVLCRGGAWNCVYPPPYEIAETTCDALDNDCNGRVDDVPGAGEACTAGVGPCERPGVMVCDPGTGAPRCSAVAGGPAVEVCNGIDDDCDGTVDDVDGQGDVCTVGTGVCTAVGVAICDAARARIACSAVPGQPAVEACNGLDDDCDGEIDEGTRNACGGCGALGPEICNGEDDDCDGAVDEPPCVVCVPAVEICNGVDDDCDSQIDEGTLNACGACGAAPMEVCNGRDDDCDGQIDEGVVNLCGVCGALPVEVCNGRDDDCDDQIDEGVVNGCGGCGPLPAEACNGFDDNCDGQIDEGVCVPVCDVEVCNGVDDDCDGEADEGVLNPCGRCGAVPAEVCNGVDDDCDGQADEGVTNACGVCGPLPAEVCNGIDDDCDGQTDEAVANACGRCGPVGAEVCNGVDDDCDGQTDEGVTNACGGCGAVPVEICNQTDDDCDGLVDDGVLNACGACGAAPVEICNGRDDDCDGQTDEGVTNACGGCGAVPVEICNQTDDDCDGLVDDGVLNACGACGAVPVEICNGRDDDCDGRTDEDLLNACGRCGALPAETCNGLDDDCDGQTDEGNAICGGGQLCQAGRCVAWVCDHGDTRSCPDGTDTGRCVAGTQTCANNAWGNCIGQVGPAAESCNGSDDDCDGQTDEGNAICGEGLLCQAGRCVDACPDGDGDGHDDRACGGDDCDDADRYKYPGAREVLDIRDNDCDGHADDVGLVRYQRYYRPWTPTDWEHRFARNLPAGFEADGHWVDLYPTNICQDAAVRPTDGTCVSQNGGAVIVLTHGTLQGLMGCTGLLGNYHVSLYLIEGGGEHLDQQNVLQCSRIGYVYGGNTHVNVAGGTVQLYRHRSAFSPAGRGDNMWSIDRLEGDPLYDVHEAHWRTKRAQ
jgi:hypothetical protein